MQVQVKTDVLAKNDAIAESLQQLFKEKNIFVFNLLGSPGGSGKTSLLEATLQDLAKDYRLAVIEGDLFTAKDAERIHALGVPVIQINTVGGCHLDAKMIQDALGGLESG
nr:GTP-binding protein [Veillonella denticariosi]